MSITDAGGSYGARGRRRRPPRPPGRTRHAGAYALERFAAATDGPSSAEWTAGSLRRLVNQFAAQDWIIVVFLVAELVALALGQGPGRPACAARVCGDLGVYLAAVALVRRALPWGSIAGALLYRGAVLGVVLVSYFQLRDVLPAVSTRALDARIYAFDLSVFGVEPAEWMDRFVSPVTTEWFAFFYFLYFLILAVHILPLLLFARDPRLLARFTIGVLLVFLTAHLLYMVVPGWGPYWYLNGAFHHDLRGGMFWTWVREAVDAGGAQKDIFPSLHTAGPTFVAIFSFRHRKLSPFKYTWPVVAFLATQVIIATLFLRWHYLIDVVAGLCLAAGAASFGQRIADWEQAKRERLALQPAWMPPVLPWSRPSNG